MSDAEPLVALLEIMLRTLSNVPKVKPGGHPDDIFIELSEEEKENLQCSICFSILKEARQCINKHKFCYSCIFVWSTSGNPVNHGRCPVCRADGLYVRVPSIDEKINAQLVRCSLKTCKWVGPLSLLTAHQHTTYSLPGSGSNNKGRQLPDLKISGRPRSSARSLGANTELSSPSSTSESTSHVTTPRQSQQPDTVSRPSVGTSLARSTTRRVTSNGTTTQRSRTRSRHRQPSNTNNTSASPTRRPGVSATGLPNRLTSRQRVENGRNILPTTNRQTPAAQQTQNENIAPSEQQTFTPRPPANPRPQGGPATRRLPTLPNLGNGNQRVEPARNPLSESNENGTGLAHRADNNNNNVPESRDVPTTPETPRFTIEVRAPHHGRPTGPGGFTNVRDRLVESRNRLDFLMNAFSVELDRGRQDLTAFQQEREMRRQEQLNEVRELGRRLGHVATELRGLLTQRRQIRNQIDHLVESATDSD